MATIPDSVERGADKIVRENFELRSQRDELLEACKALLELLEESKGLEVTARKKLARAAIAKVGV